jgi:UDP-N-acetyl-D-glucosamine dehydrogenase
MSQYSRPKLAIIGQGYVGLPLAMEAADAGWTVIGIDNVEEKVNRINLGISPVEDITNERLSSAINQKKYQATTDFSTVEGASVVALCVPTPLNINREPDLSLLESASRSVAPYLSNETLVVSESTSYPGTLREVIIPIINSLKSASSHEIFFASAPERVNPGDKFWNQKNTPRLVGGINEASQIRATSFYTTICDEVVSVSSPEIAEAAKLLENTFRLVNIALINQFAQLCAVSGINVHEVIDAASSKPYGFMQFKPGVGVGGHCIPIDPLYLTWWARKNGASVSLVDSADHINLEMPKYVARRALTMIDPSIKRPKILVLGVAYKPGVGDVRETPIKELCDTLVINGVKVGWHDPFVSTWEGTIPEEMTWDCDLAILAINQPGVNYESILNQGTRILDCTNSKIEHPGVIRL